MDPGLSNPLLVLELSRFIRDLSSGPAIEIELGEKAKYCEEAGEGDRAVPVA